MDSDPPDTPTPVTVTLNDEQDLEVDRDRVAEVARRSAIAENASGEISITLVSEDRIAELNAQYLGGDGPTDVLSFPIDGLGGPEFDGEAPPLLIGEVVLCPAVAARQTDSRLEEELDLLVAHGVLHLLGYDHESEEGAERMRRRERELTGRSGARAS